MTIAEYNQSSPFRQGWETYMKADWPNAVIPKGNPYSVGSMEGEQWFRGNYAAMVQTMDCEDEP